MCGRFANHLEWEDLWVWILGDWPADAPQRFNVAPTQTVAAFAADGGHAMRWGLVPAWSKEPKTKYSTFNAVIEDVAKKPAYRAAWAAGRRCLIPVLGYYEWRTEQGGKQPYFIRSVEGDPLFLGGLWEAWHGDGHELLSCTVLTREPVASIAHIHNRMPVLLPTELAKVWLTIGVPEAAAVAVGDAPGLTAYAVSRQVKMLGMKGRLAWSRWQRTEHCQPVVQDATDPVSSFTISRCGCLFKE